MCLVVTIKVFDSMLPKVTTQFSRNRKNFEILQKLLVKHDSRGSEFLSISPRKSGRFTKSYLYSERGNFGASFYVKNSISIFFRKIGFSKGAPLKSCQLSKDL